MQPLEVSGAVRPL